MATDIKCPKCGFAFPMEAAVAEEYKKDLHNKMVTYKKQKDDEVKKHKEEMEKKERNMQELLMKTEQEHARKLTEEKNQIRHSLEEELRKSISGDFENKIQLLQQANIQSDERLREARRKELEYLKKEQELLSKEQEVADQYSETIT
jgi:hypothetical protein